MSCLSPFSLRQGIPDVGHQGRDLYYATKVYQQMSDPKFGLQLRSNDYIVEELIKELRENI